MVIDVNTSLNPFEIFTIFKYEKDSFILDSHMDFENLGRYSFIGFNPFKIIKFKNDKENPLDCLDKELKKYKIKNNTDLPFIGGAVGYLSYDLANYIERLPNNSVDDISCYDLYFGFYNLIIVCDNLYKKLI